jgi:asparagine N-glycosylation enzyme membrane subunit Stt3
MISLAYNWMRAYPVGSYLEDPFLSLQTLAVLLIVYYFQKELNVLKFGMIGGAIAVFYALALGYPHPAILPVLLVRNESIKFLCDLARLL